MTEFTPLAEAASSAVLLLFLGLPTAWRSKGFPQALCRQATTCWHVMAHMGLVIAGIAIGIGAWMARHLFGAAYVLTEMWSASAANAVWGMWQSLCDYCDKRRFYRPEHAL